MTPATIPDSLWDALMDFMDLFDEVMDPDGIQVDPTHLFSRYTKLRAAMAEHAVARLREAIERHGGLETVLK